MKEKFIINYDSINNNIMDSSENDSEQCFFDRICLVCQSKIKKKDGYAIIHENGMKSETKYHTECIEKWFGGYIKRGIITQKLISSYSMYSCEGIFIKNIELLEEKKDDDIDIDIDIDIEGQDINDTEYSNKNCICIVIIFIYSMLLYYVIYEYMTNQIEHKKN